MFESVSFMVTKSMIMKIKLLFVVVVLIFSTTLYSQNETAPLAIKKNAAVINVLGPTYVYSLGYEGVVFSKTRHAVTVHAGGMLMYKLTGFHVGASYLYFMKRNAIEVGGSYSTVNDYDSESFFNLDDKGFQPYLGYRYYPKNNKVYFKAGLSFLFVKDENDVIPFWPTFGVGFRF